MSRPACLVLGLGLGALIGPLMELIAAWLAGENALDRSS
jgi:hypothetical protein